MIWVILAVGIVLAVGGWIIMDCNFGFVGGCAMISGSLISGISIIAAILIILNVTEATVIDEKIAMYAEENANIELQIAQAVEQYQEYETSIFKSVAPESAMTLVALYPELKADTLVQAQIEVYVANNAKIKELKEKQIHAPLYRWWLYFGGATNE